MKLQILLFVMWYKLLNKILVSFVFVILFVFSLFDVLQFTKIESTCLGNK